MRDSILVAYATRYGATKEVAEAVAAVLRERGRIVNIQPVGRVRDATGYAAVVLGVPLYFGALHKDAKQFLVQHVQALGRQPTAIFALGPTGSTTDEAEWQAARAMLDQELEKFAGLAPVARALFGGKYDPARLAIGHRLIAALPASPLHGAPASDLRDWAAIRAWAADLAGSLSAVGK